MEVIIQPNAEQASLLAARYIAKIITRKPEATLGFATGSTPLKTYAELVRLHKEEKLNFAKCTAFNLDEYVGLSPEHPQSYKRFMQENLFSKINLPWSRCFIPNGMAEDLSQECIRYERSISRADGIDVQLLGIGSEGHIGFNEKSSSLASRTRIKTLTPRTREDNARFFGSADAVPKHVLTMGVGTIMEARSIVLLAFGESKAEAIAAAVEGPISAMNPASVLQMHRTVKVILDEAAASKLQQTDYYRWVFEQKPEWQKW